MCLRKFTLSCKYYQEFFVRRRGGKQLLKIFGFIKNDLQFIRQYIIYDTCVDYATNQLINLSKLGMNGRLYLFATLLAITLAISVNHQIYRDNGRTIDDAVRHKLLGKTLKLTKNGVKNLTLGSYYKISYNVHSYQLESRYLIIVLIDTSFDVPETITITNKFSWGFSLTRQLILVWDREQMRKKKIYMMYYSLLLMKNKIPWSWFSYSFSAEILALDVHIPLDKEKFYNQSKYLTSF